MTPGQPAQAHWLSWAGAASHIGAQLGGVAASVAETRCLWAITALGFALLDVFGMELGMETARITSKGQITLPKQVRVRLAVGPGDQLAFEFDESGLLQVAPVRSALPPLRGFLAREAAGKRLDCEKIDEAIGQRMRRKYGAS